MHILLHALPFLCVIALNINYLSALQVRLSEENKFNAAKQIITAKFWLRVEKGE